MYLMTNDLSIIPFIKNKILKCPAELVREPKLRAKGNLNKANEIEQCAEKKDALSKLTQTDRAQHNTRIEEHLEDQDI